MKQSHISVDFLSNTLSLTKSFYKKARKVGSPEYKELREAISENPDYEIKVITNENKNSHKNLTFKRMREYIATQANAEENLRALDRVIKIAETKGAKYPLTKKWFLATFPEYKMEITDKEIANKDADGDQHTNIILLDKAE